MDARSYSRRLSVQQHVISLKFHELSPLATSSQIAQIFAGLGCALAFVGFLAGAGPSVFLPAVAGLFSAALWRSSVARKFETLDRHRIKLERVRARLENHATIMQDLVTARKVFASIEPAASRKSRSRKAEALKAAVASEQKHKGSEAVQAYKIDPPADRQRKAKSVRRMKRSQVGALMNMIPGSSEDLGSGIHA